MEQKKPQGPVGKSYTYYDGEGRVRTELFSSEAERIGRDLVEKKSEKLKRRGDVEISPTQLRRFFDDVKAMERYLDQFHGKERENVFLKKLPEILMLKAKVSYARGRDTVTDVFQDFIERNMNTIRTINDFEVFCKFFESVYGFFYYYNVKKTAPQKR
ncbi:MAG: type III-A CRISPR-associated protein Csm2 [Pseudomonadota bacterium]|nr:type III-A CRISPR-associated protein Csm2 [Pseudomonadota bacterium]